MIMIPPMMLIIYGITIMSMLLDFSPLNLSPQRRTAALCYAAVIVAVNALAMYILGQSQYGKFYFFLVQLPVYTGFLIFSDYKGIKLFFVMLSIINFAAPPIMCVTALRSFYQIGMSTSVIVFFLCYILMGLFIYKVLKPDFNYILANCESRRFWLFCIIPVLDYVYSFLKTGYNFVQPFEQAGYWVRQIPTITVLASYILLVRVFHTTRENQLLENDKHITRLQ